MTTVPFTRTRHYPLHSDLAKALPNNLDAERSVLGAILLDNHAIVDVVKAETFNVSHFFLEQHRVIYHYMCELLLQKEPIDLVTLTNELHRKGDLEKAGGGAYIASLADGMPKVSNVEHYAKIVTEKFRLRELIHLTHNIQQRAFEESDQSDLILTNAVDSIQQIQAPPTKEENPAVVVGMGELLSLELPKAESLIDPLITRGGTFMLYSWAGWGKSWIATELSFRLAHGIPIIFDGHKGPGGHWPILHKMRALYLYGEMHGEKIRDRLILIAKGNRMLLEGTDLAVLSKDYQRIARAAKISHSWRPSIATERDRKIVEERLFGEGYEFLVLDNISTLWSAAQEDQSKQTATLKDWFIDLNMRGITVLFLQHAGKSGDFLGDSSQVHILDSVVKLKHAPDYKHEEDGLRVVLDIEKHRYESRQQTWLAPFEAQLRTSPESGAEWFTRPARDAQIKAAFQMFADGMPTVLVGMEVGISRSTGFRWKKLFDENRDAKHWIDRNDA